MNKVLFTFLTFILFAASANAQVNNLQVRTVVCQYLDKDPNTNTQPLDDLVLRAAQKFDKGKADQKIDSEDIKMLYGEGGHSGVLDYLLSRFGRPINKKPTPLELSMRRFLEYSVLDLTIKLDYLDLVYACADGVGLGLSSADIPFLIDDGFLSELINTINKTKDLDKKEILILKAQVLIDGVKQFKLNLSQTTKFNELKDNFETLKVYVQYDQAQVPINSEDVKDYLLNNYLPKYNYYSIMNAYDLADLTILKILQGGGLLTDADIKLLVGDGKLYYLLAQRAENTPKDTPLRGQRIAQIILLSDYIRMSAPYKKLPDNFKEKWQYFNKFVGGVDENMIPYGSIIEKYEMEIKRRSIEINGAPRGN